MCSVVAPLRKAKTTDRMDFTDRNTPVRALNFLVTGASGFVGRALVAQLFKTGNTGTAVSRTKIEAFQNGWMDELSSQFGVKRRFVTPLLMLLFSSCRSVCKVRLKRESTRWCLEYRISKSETNSNVKNSKFKMKPRLQVV